MIDKKKQGKRNRINGANFERLVRKDLENKGWIISKWQNTVEFGPEFMCDPISDVLLSNPPQLKCKRCGNCWFLDGETPICKTNGKLIPAKASRFRLSSTGFPDFMAYKKDITNEPSIWKLYSPHGKSYISYEVIAIECKTNGYLDKIEKQKCRWLIDNHIFSKILIAKKTKVKNRIVIEYKEFQWKW